jgi:hypothetical protein
MDQTVAMAKGKRGVEHWVANAEALALGHSGQLREARRVSNRALDPARQEGKREPAATYRLSGRPLGRNIQPEEREQLIAFLKNKMSLAAHKFIKLTIKNLGAVKSSGGT